MPLMVGGVESVHTNELKSEMSPPANLVMSFATDTKLLDQLDGSSFEKPYVRTEVNNKELKMKAAIQRNRSD